MLPDATHSFLFVSLIDGGPWDVDGKGGVGKLGLDGTHYTYWIHGLNSPKGLGRHGNRLYVADISYVAVIDIAKGRIEKKIPIEGATGLNDITVDDAGIVYVSDSKAARSIESKRMSLHCIWTIYPAPMVSRPPKTASIFSPGKPSFWPMQTKISAPSPIFPMAVTA